MPAQPAGSRPGHRRRHRLARVAARAVLRKRDLAARQLRLVLREVLVASRRVLHPMRAGRLEEEAGNVERLRLGGLEVRGILPRVGDRDRRDALAADQRVEMQQPLFAERPDVDEHAVERAERADRIGAVLEHARRPDRARRFEELRQRPLFREVVELAVVEAAAGERFLAPPLALQQPRQQQVDRVHRPRVVDVVGRDERGVERPRARGVKQLEDEGRRIRVPVEDPVHPEVLRPDVGAEVFPLRVLRVRRRLHRVRADVAEGARHADAVRPHQRVRVVVRGIGVVAIRVPRLRGRVVEVGVGKQAQPDDPRGIPVERAALDRLAARAGQRRRGTSVRSRTDPAGSRASADPATARAAWDRGRSA